MQPAAFFQRPRRTFPEMDPARRRLVIAGLVASALLFVGGFVMAAYLWKLSRQFPDSPYRQPSRLYGSATELAPGALVSADEMVAELKESGYREAAGDPRAPLPRGAFRRTAGRVAVHLRPFPTPDGPAGGVPVAAAFRGNRITGVWVAGRPAPSATLEPPLLASFYDDEVEERRPVTLDELPDLVVKAVLAAEDDRFFRHPGVSPSGVARALWVNLRGGEMQQGGSTITQQLVKNVYLSSQRTLSRKAKEAVIAVMLEVRHGKRAILEAYLNEIYLGRSGPANLIGFGAASRAFFGKDAAELDLDEAATLAGMIQAPADYSPVEHPDKALERRNRVLERMGELDWITPEQLRQAVAAPVRTNPRRVDPRPLAPYFADAAQAEARERFGLDELGGEGYLLFSTLRRRDQLKAEASVEQGLGALAKGWEKGSRRRKPLQAALISVDPRDGSVLSWVGGRDYGKSQFNRVVQAHRQVGSAFKPVIYGTAFAEGAATPASLFRDSPINVRIGNASWRPQNYDRGFHGWVTARTALEQSLNIPTVRLALQVGMPRVIDIARGMGFTGELEAVPSLALGAFEATPMEMAQVYSTLAAGGLKPSIHGLATVLDRGGEPVPEEDELPTPKRVLDPQAAYLVTSILQGVVDHGTAAGARGQGVQGPLAGKTGTTNDRRDSWFAGYSPDRVTVVWVGYDDNSSTQLSGARAALPIWSRFTAAVRPAGGYRDFGVPAGIVKVMVDPVTGQLATDLCPNRVTEVFPEWQAPAEPCQRHSPTYGGEVLADVSLGQPLLDPETGLPLDPSSTEEPRYTVTDDGLMITDPGGDEPIVISPAQTFPPSGPSTGPQPEDGTIEIRPARAPQPPRPAAPEPVAGATGAAGMTPAPAPQPPPEPGIVPAGGQPIGAAGGQAGAQAPVVEEETPPP
ncbi:MAG TPA: PBP1A family penicillin-binding protein [Thermoanaerobaculia bacterium]|nr:PBP1A family penicillin-binding protein [Thermoanaerobaculia bacterium]